VEGPVTAVVFEALVVSGGVVLARRARRHRHDRRGSETLATLGGLGCLVGLAVAIPPCSWPMAAVSLSRRPLRCPPRQPHLRLQLREHAPTRIGVGRPTVAVPQRREALAVAWGQPITRDAFGYDQAAQQIQEILHG